MAAHSNEQGRCPFANFNKIINQPHAKEQVLWQVILDYFKNGLVEDLKNSQYNAGYLKCLLDMLIQFCEDLLEVPQCAEQSTSNNRQQQDDIPREVITKLSSVCEIIRSKKELLEQDSNSHFQLVKTSLIKNGVSI